MPQSRHGPDEGAAGGPPFRYIAPALQSAMRHDPITRSRRQLRGFLRNRTIPWACLLLVVAAWLGAGPARAEPLPVVRIGVLKFGTVNWELDVIRRHGLDRAHGFALEPTELADEIALMTELDFSPAERFNSELVHETRRFHVPEHDLHVRQVAADILGVVTVRDIVAISELGGAGFRVLLPIVGNK